MRTTHFQRRCALVACGLVLGSAAGAQAASAQSDNPGSRVEPRTLYATTAKNTLVSFDSRAPRRILTRRPITGLTGGVTLKGIDFRPRTGDLYGVGSDSVVYRIDPNTAIAISEGPASSTLLDGRFFGFDFNPVVDKIRVVSDTGQNLRLNVDEGTLLSVDGSINPSGPQIVGSAYLNSGFSLNLAPATMLFAIDARDDQILLQNPPNNGTLTNAKPLDIDVKTDTGFDIAGDDNDGFLVTRSGRGSRLYTVDPMTGDTRRRGMVGNGRLVLTGLAAWQDAADNPPPPAPAPTPTPSPTPTPTPTPPSPPSPTPSPAPIPTPTPPSQPPSGPPSSPAPPGSGFGSVIVDQPPRITLARFVRKGLRITGSCRSGARGTLRIAVSRSQARSLGLRGNVLASRTVRCSDLVSVRLKPSARTKSALRRASRSVRATLQLKSRSGRDSVRLVLRRR